MKKVLVAVLVLVSVFAFANLALADKYVVVGKGGLNAFGSEIEKIQSNGTGYFFSEASYYGERDYWGYWDYDYALLVGVKKHAAINKSHTYIGLGVGVSNWYKPTIDGTLGYEMHISALPEFLFFRGEAGLSVAFLGKPMIDPTIHAGIGLGVDISFFRDLFDF